MTRRARRPLEGARAARAAGLVLLAGCFPVVSQVRTGAVVPDERLAALRDGQTTRREVLEALGPPLAVVRRQDGVVRVPDVGMRRSGASEVAAAAFFERFAAHDEAPLDVVYFYREHELITSGFGFFFGGNGGGGVIGGSSDENREDRLWILIDGATGVVKAHVHERDVPERHDDGVHAADPGAGGGEP